MNTYTINRFLILLLASLLIGGFATVSLAQEPVTETSSSSIEEIPESEARETGSTNPRRNEIIERQETRVEDRVESIEDRVEERIERVETRQDLRTIRQSALTEIRQQRVLNLSANISNRMEAAIARLYAIVGRLEIRIQKLTEAGTETGAASAKVREAAEHLANAQSLMGNIDTQVFNATTSPTPLSSWTEVRSIYIEVGQLIRASHQALRESISLLKTAMNTPPTVLAPVEAGAAGDTTEVSE